MMVELSLILAVVLFLVGALLAVPQLSNPIGTFVTRLGLAILAFAFLWPLIETA